MNYPEPSYPSKETAAELSRWRNMLLKYILDLPGWTKTCTVLTIPDAATMTGRIIFVSDGNSGEQFRGSTGASWVNLG